MREGRAPGKFQKRLHVGYVETLPKFTRNDGHRDPMPCSRAFRSNSAEYPAIANG